MRVGTTSFGFRYALLDPALGPPPGCLVEEAARAGLTRLQICENARPLEAPPDLWAAALEAGRNHGVELGLGCKTLNPEVFERYVRLAEGLPNRTLRLVVEEEDGSPPSRGHVEEFLRCAVPMVQCAGLRLAIENHFDVPSKMLAAAAAAYPPELVGFCLDTANSLRNFESAGTVFDLLGDRAYCYHLKDYRVVGHQLGFAVAGAKLGAGSLDVDGVLRRILAKGPEPEIYLENWVPSSGNRASDIAADREWLADSLREFERRVSMLGYSPAA